MCMHIKSTRTNVSFISSSLNINVTNLHNDSDVSELNTIIRSYDDLVLCYCFSVQRVLQSKGSSVRVQGKRHQFFRLNAVGYGSDGVRILSCDGSDKLARCEVFGSQVRWWDILELRWAVVLVQDYNFNLQINGKYKYSVVSVTFYKMFV